MEYNYQINIRPLDYYFFGGERTFGNLEQQNYFARSNRFPQQTGVLGLLRYLGFDKIDIGKSFDPQFAGVNQNFGYINRISPLFLLDEKGEAHIPGPKLDHLKNKLSVEKSTGEVAFFNGSWNTHYSIPGYKEKNELESVLYSSAGQLIDPEQIFLPFSKIGITKGKNREERKNAFFKQQYYKLKKDWSFSVLADLGAEAEKLDEEVVSFFGGEKALFQVQLKKVNQDFNQIFPNHLFSGNGYDDLSAILLLSDAYVSADIYSACDFAISDTKSFRNIRTKAKATNFARLGAYSNAGASIYKTAKLSLLSRGSLLLSKNPKAITDELANPVYAQIGYNHYTVLK